MILIGGGLAGLQALDLLRRRGFDARLYEASDRVGGRIYSLRSSSAGGLVAEAGAERIRPAHLRVLGLARQLGITPVLYPPPQNPYLLSINGGEYRFRTPEDIPGTPLEGLSEAEKRGVPSVHLELAAEAPPVADDDSRTAWQWLKDNGMTAAGEVYVRAFAPFPLDRLPARCFQRYALAERRALGQVKTLSGGVDTLTEGLAQRHPGHITRGFKAVSITQRADQVVVRAANGTTVSAPLAVICLPVPVLKSLAFEGGTPKALADRIAGLGIEQEIKIGVEVAGAAFSGSNAPEMAFRPEFPRVVWPSPRRLDDGCRVLNMMAVNEDVPLVAAAANGGVQGITALLEPRLPRLMPHARQILFHDFSADPLAGGAWTWPKNGAPPPKGLIRSGRLVFAGSDLSAYPGWMEGALASAEAAVATLG